MTGDAERSTGLNAKSITNYPTKITESIVIITIIFLIPISHCSDLDASECLTVFCWHISAQADGILAFLGQKFEFLS